MNPDFAGMGQSFDFSNSNKFQADCYYKSGGHQYEPSNRTNSIANNVDGGKNSRATNRTGS